MEIITGRTGTPHVRAIDDAEINKLLLGDGDYVLETGNKFNATVESAQSIRISDGSIIMQGRLAKTRASDGYDTVSLDVGTAGYKRVDLICAQYRKESVSTEEEVEGETVTVTDEIEHIELVVVKGTPTDSSGDYSTPSYTQNDIDSISAGGNVHQMPLWAVRLDGINFDSLVDYRVYLESGVIQDSIDRAKEFLADYVDELTEEVDQEIADMKARASGTIPVITASTREPTSEDGEDGEFWVVYEAEESE